MNGKLEIKTKTLVDVLSAINFTLGPYLENEELDVWHQELRDSYNKLLGEVKEQATTDFKEL